VVVLIVNQYGIFAFKCEGQTPIAADSGGVMPGKIASEGMQAPTGDIQIGSVLCKVKPRQLPS